jgi:hypothetical protein
MDEQLYFAYGSNINLEQMAVRCPAATPVCPVTLDNYRLAFRGGAGHFGVAAIIPAQGEKVYGLLWKITPACEVAWIDTRGIPASTGRNRSPCGTGTANSTRHGVHHGAGILPRSRRAASRLLFGHCPGLQAKRHPRPAAVRGGQRTRIEAEQVERPPWLQMRFDNIKNPGTRKRTGRNADKT